MEERDTQLSQAYRDAPHPEPSSALDARILEAARQAMAKPTARRRPSWFAWAVPFSTAAVLVLGITLLFEMQRQAPEVLESPTAIPPAVSLEKAETATEQEAKQAESGILRSQDKVAKPTSSVAGPARAQSKESPKRSAPEPVAADSAAPIVEAPQPQPFPAQPAAVPAPPPPPAVKAAPMPVPEAARSTGGAGNLADQAAEAMSMPPPQAMESTNAGASALGNAQAKRKFDKPIETPKQMVETIRRLMREGYLDEAKQTLDRLRRTYPGFDVPEDLRRLQVR